MPREWIFLECSGCRTRYYRTTRNPKQQGKTATKLELKKFCSHCRKHTLHVEKKK